MNRNHLRRVAQSMFSVAILVAVASCSSPTREERDPRRVLLIGLDGAEWSLLRPLMDAGKMPNLARLADTGVHGELRSIEPMTKSPAIWTTIATGKTPEEHGIYDFLDKIGGHPLTQNARQVKALWSIFSDVGRSVGVVGWLMSWPAERVNGFVVSDYLQYEAQPGIRFDRRTWPEDLIDEISPMNRRWQQMTWTEVNRFLSIPLDESEIDEETRTTIQPIKWMIAPDAAFTDIAVHLGARERPDFMAVYLRSPDTMGHLYWNYQEPEQHDPDLTIPRFRPFLRDTMRLNYEWIDEQVGRILELADENTTVVVCSDHGFVGGSGRGVGAHRPEGILIMNGHQIGTGEITGADVYDVAPTVLALMGLPKAEDMHGDVLWEAFDETLRPDMFPSAIATYETGEPSENQDGLESPVDAELLERLKSLGYVN